MMFLVVLNSLHSRYRLHLADGRRCWCMGSSAGGTGASGIDRWIGLKFLELTYILCMIRQVAGREILVINLLFPQLNKGVTQWD